MNKLLYTKLLKRMECSWQVLVESERVSGTGKRVSARYFYDELKRISANRREKSHGNKRVSRGNKKVDESIVSVKF